jgi:hypothetical protein
VARYFTPVTSATALAVDTAVASVVSTNVRYRIRRVIIGAVAGTSAIADQQVAIGVNRATARGTATTTLTPGKMDDGSAAPGMTGIDSAWSVQPTLFTQDLFRVPFNLKSGCDIPVELLEELWGPANAATPIVFVNRYNALPASTSYVISIQTEE